MGPGASREPRGSRFQEMDRRAVRARQVCQAGEGEREEEEGAPEAKEGQQRGKEGGLGVRGAAKARTWREAGKEAQDGEERGELGKE